MPQKRRLFDFRVFKSVIYQSYRLTLDINLQKRVLHNLFSILLKNENFILCIFCLFYHT